MNEELKGLIEVPNLDDFSNDPDLHDELGMLFDRLAAYSHMKAKAMRLRKKGNINQANFYELALEGLHENLPEWARW
jgi:hypothetical protein